jgi:hypothetical protein
MERLFDGIPLDSVSTSMTINATASTLLCLYLAVARKQNVSFDKVKGTLQNDILKEYIARGTYIYPPSPSLRLVTDTFAYCTREVPAEGGEPVQVTKEGGFLAFESLDGKYVYYTKDRDVQLTPGIWQTPVEGGDETVVLDSFDAANWGNWAVVEEGIYFINCDAKRACAIEFFDFARRRVTQVAALGQDVIFLNGLAVSPDRRQFLYTREDDTGGVDIWLVENFR